MDSYRKFRLTMSVWCGTTLTLLALLATLHVGSASADADGAATAHEGDKVTPFEFTGDVRDLLQVPLDRDATRRPYHPLLPPPPTVKRGAPVEEPAPSAIPTPLAPMPAPMQNFAGLSFADTCGGVQCGAGWPPDINGDVGLNHYIVAVNDAYAIYSKTGTLLASFTENQLWSTDGANPCNGNSQGDPVVLYDQLADRWILTHFAFAVSGGTKVSPFYQCIAASKTSDPVSGGWWLYPVRMDPGGAGQPPVGAFNDYGKFGIWPDCLYMAANEFQYPGGSFIGTAFASFSRNDLYSGAPLTMALGFINNTTNPFTMIPSNLSGSLAAQLPAPGTPNYFVSESQTVYAFEVRKFTAGTNCGGGGSLSAATNVSQANYSVPANSAVVPQPSTTNKLDVLSDRLMQKVQYRKVGTAESVWVVHSTQASTTSTVRPQWAQLDVTGGVISTTPVQQQIYAPDTLLHRWMPSLAVDSQGNMALGYSTSNDSSPNFPSIAYSGRLATDPLNTLPQSEVQLVAGLGAQTNNCGGAPCHRWGDYTAMSVDPADDCTFWYTNEYYSSATNGANGNWQTRVGSFKFSSCNPPGGTFSGWAALPGGGQTPSGPAVVIFNGAPQVFVRGTDDRIYQNFLMASGWSGWSEVPGGGLTPSGPGATVFSNTLYLFVRGTNSRIYQNLLTASGWSGWSEVPGGGFTPSGPGATVFNNTLYLFVRGTDDRIYQNRLTAGSWSGWSEVPGGGATFAGPAAAVFQNFLYLTVQGTDNRIYDNLLTSVGWTGWAEVPGNLLTSSGPAATVFNGELWYVVRGMDDRVYRNRLPAAAASDWTGWVEVPGGGFTPSGPGAAATASTLYLVVRGTDNGIYLNQATVP